MTILCEEPSLHRRLQACLAAGGLDTTTPGDSANGVTVVAGKALAELDDSGDSVVAVLPTEHPPVLRRVLRAGARGIVAEREVETMLVPAVAAVAVGFLCVPPELRRQLDRPALSPREKQVLGLVVMGLSNSEIAARLHVAPATVKSHLTSSFEKLGVRSRSQATDLLLDPKNGLGLGVLSLSGGRRQGAPVNPEQES